MPVNPGQWITIRQISDDYGVSRNHMMKVVSFLSGKGYVNSQRGPGGGIRLRKSAPQISLAELIVDAEGDLTLLDCMRDGHEASSDSERRLQSVLNQGVSALVDTLGTYSLADLVTPAPGQPPAALEA